MIIDVVMSMAINAIENDNYIIFVFVRFSFRVFFGTIYRILCYVYHSRVNDM